MLSRSLPAKLSVSWEAKLSPSYLHGFQSVQHAISLPPSEALPKLFARFPVRPACCLAPSQRSFPQAICTVFSPSSMLSPSQRSFPQAICTVSSPSSMLSRSLPAKLSPSYLHGFQSVQHAVSLPPSEAFRTLFAPPLPSLLPSFLPSFLLFPFLPSFLPPFLPSLPLPPSLPPFLPSFLPSFLLFPILLSFLPISVPSPSNTPYHSLATKCLNENPGIGDAFGKNEYGRNMTQQRNCSFVNWKVWGWLVWQVVVHWAGKIPLSHLRAMTPSDIRAWPWHAMICNNALFRNASTFTDRALAKFWSLKTNCCLYSWKYIEIYRYHWNIVYLVGFVAGPLDVLVDVQFLKDLSS